MEYAYSGNEEDFYGGGEPTIVAALKQALQDYPDNEMVWVGEVTRNTIGGFFDHSDVTNLFEQLRETAGDECGEAAEDWLDLPNIPTPKGETREARELRWEASRAKQREYLAPLVADIRAALEKWATENDEQPGFYHVGNSRQYTREEAQAIIGAASEVSNA